MAAAFYAEALKARRSLVPWLVGVFAMLPPVMLGLMMAIKKHPADAQRFGLLTTKSRLLVGAVDWPTFLGLVGQTMGALGAIAFAVVAAWVFGREFAERTCRIMLAIPTRRSSVVVAKAGVAAMWCLLLACWMVALGFAVGAIVGMPGLTLQLVRDTLALTGRSVLLWLLLLPVTALLASVGRGYLLPIGCALATMIVAQFVSATGWSPWFPWCVAIASGTPGTHVAGASLAVVVLTGLAALAATLLWWERSDQTV
ncbi:MAG TPA: ABC transporter permease [bacterium]|nr:ABC transporter permease [bacterium]